MPKRDKDPNSVRYPLARLQGLSEFMAFARDADWRPARIDTALLARLGIAQGKEAEVIYALEFLGLIDDNNTPTSEFEELKQNYQVTMRRLVQAKYGELFSIIPPRLINQARLMNFFGPPIERAEYQARLIFWFCEQAGIELLDLGKHMDAEKLNRLLRQPEGLKLEFKQTLYRLNDTDPQQRAIGWDALIRDILALANGNVGASEQPAYLIIGVGDKLNSDGSRELFNVGDAIPTTPEILSRVNANCHPPLLDIRCETVRIDNKRIFVITIPPTPYLHQTTRRLVGPNGRTAYQENSVFIRVGETTKVASPAELTGVLADKQKILKPQESVEEPQPATFAFTFDFLHLEIARRCRSLFQSAYYDEAILNAFKVIEEKVRHTARLRPEDIGVKLMSDAFNVDSPRLVYSQIKAEQEGALALFRGGIGCFKNPHSHRFVNVTDPVEAFEILCFASTLCRVVDAVEVKA